MKIVRKRLLNIHNSLDTVNDFPLEIAFFSHTSICFRVHFGIEIAHNNKKGIIRDN